MPQMHKKGRIQVGMDADIVVFDPATIADPATFASANQQPVGVQTVLLNDGFAGRGGELVLAARYGRPIRNAVTK